MARISTWADDLTQVSSLPLPIPLVGGTHAELNSDCIVNINIMRSEVLVQIEEYLPSSSQWVSHLSHPNSLARIDQQFKTHLFAIQANVIITTMCTIHGKAHLSVLLSLEDVPGDIEAVTKQKVPALGLRNVEATIKHTSHIFNLSSCVVHHKHLQCAPVNSQQKEICQIMN